MEFIEEKADLSVTDPDAGNHMTKRKKTQTRTKLQFEFDPDQSDQELPSKAVVKLHQITSGDFLKLFS